MSCLAFVFAQVSQCLTELDGVERRLKSGIEERNSWDLQRETLKALAIIVDDNELGTAIFLEFGGVGMLHMTIASASIPVKASTCKVIGTLVKSQSIAKKLLEDSLLGKVVRCSASFPHASLSRHPSPLHSATPHFPGAPGCRQSVTHLGLSSVSSTPRVL